MPVRLRLGPRLRSALFWATAMALSVGTGLTVSGMLGEASERADRLGGLRAVPVATRAVAAGQELGAPDVALRQLPAAALPHGKVAERPSGHTVVVPLSPGEVILESKLAPWGVHGLAALVPPGRRALAVPSLPGGLGLQRGHRVDLLATLDSVESGPEPTFPVASGALVVEVGEEAVTVAVMPEEATRVAFAIARGTVTLALTPGSESSTSQL